MHQSPTAEDIDTYLQDIGRKFGVDWKPPMRTEEKYVNARFLCAYNIVNLHADWQFCPRCSMHPI